MLINIHITNSELNCIGLYHQHIPAHCIIHLYIPYISFAYHALYIIQMHI